MATWLDHGVLARSALSGTTPPTSLTHALITGAPMTASAPNDPGAASHLGAEPEQHRTGTPARTSAHASPHAHPSDPRQVRQRSLERTAAAHSDALARLLARTAPAEVSARVLAPHEPPTHVTASADTMHGDGVRHTQQQAARLGGSVEPTAASASQAMPTQFARSEPAQTQPAQIGALPKTWSGPVPARGLLQPGPDAMQGASPGRPPLTDPLPAAPAWARESMAASVSPTVPVQSLVLNTPEALINLNTAPPAGTVAAGQLGTAAPARAAAPGGLGGSAATSVTHGTQREPASPIRLHADWHADGVRLWLGLNATLAGQQGAIALQLQQWLRQNDVRLLSLTCNGRPMPLALSTTSAPHPQAAAPSHPEPHHQENQDGHR